MSRDLKPNPNPGIGGRWPFPQFSNPNGANIDEAELDRRFRADLTIQQKRLKLAKWLRWNRSRQRGIRAYWRKRIEQLEDMKAIIDAEINELKGNARYKFSWATYLRAERWFLLRRLNIRRTLEREAFLRGEGRHQFREDHPMFFESKARRKKWERVTKRKERHESISKLKGKVGGAIPGDERELAHEVIKADGLGSSEEVPPGGRPGISGAGGPEEGTYGAVDRHDLDWYRGPHGQDGGGGMGEEPPP